MTNNDPSGKSITVNTNDRVFMVETESTPKTERHQEILDHIHQCPLCGDDLDFSYSTDYVMLTVNEESNCNSCGIRTKNESHCIQ